MHLTAYPVTFPWEAWNCFKEGAKHPKAPCLNTLMPVPWPLSSQDIRKGVQALLTNMEVSVTAFCPVFSQTAKSNSWKNLTFVREVPSPHEASRRAAEPGMRLHTDVVTVLHSPHWTQHTCNKQESTGVKTQNRFTQSTARRHRPHSPNSSRKSHRPSVNPGAGATNWAPSGS